MCILRGLCVAAVILNERFVMYKYLPVLGIFMVGCGLMAKEADKNTAVQSMSCYSDDNFDYVYAYVEKDMGNKSLPYFEFDGYELYTESGEVISIKKEGWTLSKVIRGKGVVALPKNEPHNSEVAHTMNAVFCNLVILAH